MSSGPSTETSASPPTNSSSDTTSTGSSNSSAEAESKPASNDDIDIPPAGSSSKAPTSLEAESEDGKSLFKIVHAKSSGNVLSSEGKILLSFVENKESKSKYVRVEDASHNCIGYVKFSALNKMKLEDSNKKELFMLHFEQNDKVENAFKLKDANNKTLYKIKDESYGLKLIEGEDGRTLYKVKVKNNKTKLKSEDGKTVLCSKSDAPPTVLACFGMDKLTKEQQYSLAYALEFMRF